MHALLVRGTYTMWARTVPECMTLPAHSSMLTGVSVEKHGISWNGHIEDAYPDVPTIFELAHKVGQTSAMVSGKTKFIALLKPGTLDWHWLPYDEPIADQYVADKADDIIRQHQPNVCFIHLAGTDAAGHKWGWGSDEQLAAIALADSAVATVIRAVEDAHLSDSTMILLTADHGGAGKFHAPGDARSLHIPWIAVGPGIRKNLDLTEYAALDVDTTDTFVTACVMLGIPLPADFDGKPILEIVERAELLQSVAP